MEMNADRTVILCIDDETLILEIISDFLESSGYRAISCSDGNDGITLFHECNPSAVLVDLKMPGMSGLEVLAHVSSASPETPVIVVSGTGSISDVIEALRLGAWDYIMKPIEDMTILELALEKSLEKASLIRENRLYRERLELLVDERTRDLMESEKRFRMLAENAHDMISRMKIPELTFEYISPSVKQIFGYAPEDFYADSTLLWKCFPEDEKVKHEGFWENAKNGDIAPTIEYRIIDASGNSRWIHQSNVVVNDASGVFIAIESISADITDMKKIEAEREELISDLKSKNQELERFTYTVSHDLRSPLVTIKGFIGMLEEDMENGDSERVREDMQRISSAADKMNILLKDLLELSRVGRIANAYEQFSLESVVRDVQELLHGKLGERGAVLEIENALPVVSGDLPRIREVFQNLIENAIKFTGNTDSPRITVGCKRKNGRDIIYVKDNGIGIEKANQERVFGLFEKLDRSIEGTGLGLALVRRIIEVHGGTIWVNSEGEGKGAVFCFTIPGEKQEAR